MILFLLVRPEDATFQALFYTKKKKRDYVNLADIHENSALLHYCGIQNARGYKLYPRATTRLLFNFQASALGELRLYFG